jgi:nucleotidyltransferase substrate binding protein (TIGR01987 family)
VNNNTDIRWQQRLDNLEKAYKDFSDACSLTKYSKLERSGLIQTFEFTFELLWKTLQDLLVSQGYVGINGPRPVLEKAFQDGWITQGDEWIKMMISRNLTSHSYNEKTAEEIAKHIKTLYFPLIRNVLETLRNERAK